MHTLERWNLQALQLGSAAQVELWEPAAMILAYTTIGDVVELRRVADRLKALAPSTPSLVRYAQLAELALDFVRSVAVEPAGLSVEASVSIDCKHWRSSPTRA